MSARRPGTCGDAGPYDYHCTLDRGHDGSCHDGGADSSYNRGPAMWQTAAPHNCADPSCRDNPKPS